MLKFIMVLMLVTSPICAKERTNPPVANASYRVQLYNNGVCIEQSQFHCTNTMKIDAFLKVNNWTLDRIDANSNGQLDIYYITTIDNIKAKFEALDPDSQMYDDIFITIVILLLIIVILLYIRLMFGSKNEES